MAKRLKINSTSVGKQFENKVASLFATAGYKVDRNEPVIGQQVDLVVTHFETLGLQRRLVVECKYKTDSSVSNNEVQDFVTYVQPLLTQGYSGGVLVTNTDFSLSAKTCAKAFPFITLRTYSDLEDSIFDFSRSFVTELNSYQHTDVAHKFIELSGKKSIQTHFSDPEEIAGVSLLSDLIDLVSQDGEAFLAFILGDFGVGKTTIIERANYEFQNKYVADRKSKIPLLFRLNKFVEASTLNQYLESQIAFNLRIQIPASRIFQLCQAGRAVIFLDGFDEIATNASEYRRMSYFENLLPLIAASRYTVISSRPSYFKNAAEFDALLSRVLNRRLSFERPTEGPIRRRDEEARHALRAAWGQLSSRILGGRDLHFSHRTAIVYYVNKLDKDQIVGYISQFKEQLHAKYKLSSEAIYDILMNVYDISDLMTRPLLLKLIVDVLLISSIDLEDPNLSIGPAALYRMYIDAHLAIDWSKGAARHFLEKEERLKFAKGMALAMLYGDGSLSVSYTNIVDTIINVAHSFSPEREKVLVQQVDEVCTDVRVCAFLRFRDQERFEFIHKSFMEYFVADEIRERLHSNASIDILRQNLNYEILYFLGSFALIDANILHQLLYQLRNIAYREQEAYKRNVIGAILYSGQETRGFKISQASLDRLKFRALNLTSIEIEKTTFDEFVVDKISFSNVSFRETDMTKSSCAHLSLLDCAGELTLCDSQVSELRVLGGEAFTLDLLRTSVESLAAAGNMNINVHVSAHTSLKRVNAQKISITFQGLSDPEYGIDKPAFFGCMIQTSRGPDGTARRRINQGQFAACAFRNFRMLYADAKQATFGGCFGVIIADDVHEKERDFFKTYRNEKRVVRRKWMYNDGVLFVDSKEFQASQLITLERMYFDFDRREFERNPVVIMDKWLTILNPPPPPPEDNKKKKSGSRRVTR